MIKRLLASVIKAGMFGGKVIILTGPRQVGKTTLARILAENSGSPYKWFNADEPDVRAVFTDITSTRLRDIFGAARLIVIDEAQRIFNIGITLKLAVDNFPEIQVLATGSSALELAGGINEPLTGRKWEFTLFPLSFAEMAMNKTREEEHRLLEHRLVYGYYPDVINHPGNEKNILVELISSYLYKDFLSLEQVRKPALVEKLLLTLAFQVGSEVSYHELGQLIGADNETVERYINLLEKIYVIFTLGAFSRNLRNEIKRNRKIYFWDNGVRNALISNFNPTNIRNDTGALWDNFLIVERLKNLHYQKIHCNKYFWRTSQQQEIDYVEERGGKLYVYEFKYSVTSKARIPNIFLSAYPGSEPMIVTRDNYFLFIGVEN
jgi:uncharacterized protein